MLPEEERLCPENERFLRLITDHDNADPIGSTDGSVFYAVHVGTGASESSWIYGCDMVKLTK